MNKMGSKADNADIELLQAQCVIQHLLCSIARLEEENEQFIAEFSCNSHPFAWTATTDSIMEKVKRLGQRISGTRHLGIAIFNQ